MANTLDARPSGASRRGFGRRHFARLAAGATALGLGVATAACSPAAPPSSPGNGQRQVVTVRLWDEQVQKAYDASFAEFEKANPDIDVQTVLVPYSDYFTKLRTDVSGGNADDIFMINGSYIQPYIEAGQLVEIGADFDAQRAGWVPAAVEQYTFDGKLWGVPQLTDGGIAVYYNKKLLDDAKITPEQLTDLTWSPNGQGDTFLPVARKLTVDKSGRRGDEQGFDGSQPATWGYSAAQDLQGIYYNYVGSNGGQFQNPDGTFVFASPESTQAFDYLSKLINEYKVSPAASNTNDNGDFTRDQFLQGKIALFQSGVYNLKNVADGADFEWGIAPMPAGPKGAVSVVNNVVVAGNAASDTPEATKRVLQWMGTPEGARFIGADGAALPAVTGAQPAFAEYWSGRQVDPSQFAKQGELPAMQAPVGQNYSAALEAWKPTFNEIFLGRTSAADGLPKAQDAANKAMQDG
ncbi:multiple sugar transport system substrate-binding protein [Naumannella cuiyingiana]|uniref:Multiple sugar transport system substrate-binding protein n=1 Tax=Naumannella cuiyingiana TaxID=1347891 RepID=A0A7Z0D6Y3_9ACTN|nr:sugar ABC transporter substrate-binding protein [Naumannella cuiyingiana]NYI69990.1 multiple sugar transport system substrate-binding protein [Naumannella cuiyingiana]